ncbi:hypothetical protein J7E81_25980 [Bacillus sp. ISL-18]|nr:hypothetical protein [Bacillus sp. ISL-18]
MNKTDKVILFLILILVFFLRDIKVLYEPWYIFDLFLLIYIFFQSTKNEAKGSLGHHFWMFISVGLLVVIAFLNIYFYGFGKVFINNILMIFTPATLLLYTSYMSNRYEYDVLFKLGRKILIFLNIYFWINVPIIILQFITGTFMMGRFLSWGMYAFDHMTGFIGPFGTGILNIFWCALLLGNLFYYLMEKQKVWLILFWVQIPTMLILSYFNENKSFIPTVILFLGLFIFYVNFSNKFSFKAVFNFIIILIIGLFLSLIAYLSSDVIREQVDKLLQLASDFFVNGTPSPENERAYLNYLAFRYFDAMGLGMGINNLDFNHQTIHKNLGINSLSLIVIQGGVWYYLSIINIYTVLTVRAVKNIFEKSTFLLYFLFYIIYGFISLITQPFRDHYTMIMVALLVFFLTIWQKGEELKELDQN